MKINSLCILGGGTSGFIVSSIFAKYREASGLDFDIKLIHSDKIGSIGVGESTIFNINEWTSKSINPPYLGNKDGWIFNKLLPYALINTDDTMDEINIEYSISEYFINNNIQDIRELYFCQINIFLILQT